MSPPVSSGPTTRRRARPLARFGAPRLFDSSGLPRRLAYFWIVWSALLLLHEAGHAVVARWQGLAVRRVTVGVGPEVWQFTRGSTDVVVRLLPVLGMTSVAEPSGTDARSWLSREAPLAGGVAATLAAAVLVAAGVLALERRSGRRFVLGRLVIGDALVLTVFNFLPVPPLDGGRVVLSALAAARGAPLAGDALFWVHLGGLTLALVPILVWTRWTAPIDAAVLTWWAPRGWHEPEAPETGAGRPR
jgi:membrane-associated protease RseP (regulator of RpoE activity)